MFCKYCGKEIPEGEVCFCPDAVNQRTANNNPQPAEAPAAPAAGAAGDIGKTITATLKGMPAAGKQLLGNTSGAGQTLASAIVFAIAGLLAHLLGWILIITGAVNAVVDLAVSAMGSLSSVMGSPVGVDYSKEIRTGILNVFKGIHGAGAWWGCLIYILTLAVSVGIGVVGQLLRKEKMDVIPCFITGASLSVVPAAVFLLGSIFCLFWFQGGMFLFLIAIIYGIVSCGKQLQGLVKNSESAVSGLITAAVLTVIIALVAWIVTGAMGGYIEDILGELPDLEDILSELMGGLF